MRFGFRFLPNFHQLKRMSTATPTATATSTTEVQRVMSYWFGTVPNFPLWFGGSPEVDLLVKEQFLSLHQQIASNRKPLEETEQGMVASIVVLDQFSRNMFRNSPAAFEYDSLAVEFAQKLRDSNSTTLTPHERLFSYMPFMHSENMEIQELSLIAFEELKQLDADKFAGTKDYAVKHYDIVKRFGRYPHRNVILGRDSTQEEVEFLKTPGSSF